MDFSGLTCRIIVDIGSLSPIISNPTPNGQHRKHAYEITSIANFPFTERGVKLSPLFLHRFVPNFHQLTAGNEQCESEDRKDAHC